MATLSNKTEWRINADLATVAIPEVQAGAKLVCVSWGGAIVTAKLGVAGTNFTKRAPTSLSGFEVSCQDIIAAGGETIVQIDLNGNENVDGVIFEFAPGTLGDFLTGIKADSMALTSASHYTLPGSLTVAQSAVMFSAWIKGESGTDPSLVRGHWGINPPSMIASRRGNVSPTLTKFFGQCGVADITSGSYTVQTAATVSGSSAQGGAWAYADASGVPTYDTLNKIAKENSRPGLHYTQWMGVSPHANVSGYCDKTSYLPGDTVGFKVYSNNVGFNVEINRLGGYGSMLFGARRVATVAGTPAVQPAPTTDALGAVSCGWSTTASWTVPADAAPGVYSVVFRRTDNTAFASPGVFIVRPSKPTTKQDATIGFRLSDITWQAYNGWGATTDAGSTASGRSIYGPGNLVLLSDRAFSVSFDRPYSTMSTFPQTWLMDAEISMIHFLEQNGYDVDYYSSIDVENDPEIPSMYGIFLGSGHDEYITENIWQGLADARDAGTNLWFDGGNFALWHVRFAASDVNKRKMICYKDSHDTVGFDGITKYDPVEYTGTWRDSRTTPGGVNNPDRRPESQLCGQWFIANGPQTLALQVPGDDFKTLPCWRDTAVASLGAGATYTSPIGTTLGYEWDYVKTDEPTTPTNLVRLASREVVLTNNAASDNGDTYNQTATAAWGASLYRASSGALVFCAGTWRWGHGVSRFRGNALVTGGAIDLALQQCTVNVLRDMGIAPATLLDDVRNGADGASALTDPGDAADPTAYGLVVDTESGAYWLDATLGLQPLPKPYVLAGGVLT